MTGRHEQHRMSAASTVVLLLVAAATFGCGQPGTRMEHLRSSPSDTVGEPVPWQGRYIQVMAPSHRGDQAILYWRVPDTVGWQRSLVDFAAKRERIIDEGEIGLLPSGKWSPDDRLFAADTRRWAGILDVETLEWRPIRHLAGLTALHTASPRWSPDGQHLLLTVFVEGLAPDEVAVCLYTTETAACTLVAAGGSIHRCENPFWGDKFVFSRSASGREAGTRGRARRRFFVRGLAALGANPYRQRELLPHRFIETLSVSPVGNAVAALCLPEEAVRQDADTFRGSTLHIVVDPDRPRERQLSAARFGSNFFKWSTVGDRILVTLWQDPAEEQLPRLAILDAESGEMEVLRDSQGRLLRGTQPYWVDGDRRILYLRDTPGDGIEVWCYVLASKAHYRIFPWVSSPSSVSSGVLPPKTER